MIDFLFKGGPIMVPLLLSSVIALGVVLDRIWALRGRSVLPTAVAQALIRVEGDKHIDQLLQLCERYTSPLSRVVRQGFMNRQKPRQETLQILQNLGRRETAERPDP